MSTPIETAAEGIEDAWSDAMLDGYGDEGAGYDTSVLARAAFASLARHRDDIARALYEFQVRSDIPLGVAPGPAWDDLPDEWRTGWREAADVALGVITGGAS